MTSIPMEMENESLLATLKAKFGFSAFRPGQKTIISVVLQAKHCVAVLPTGGGKSLCFQLPALIRPGLTLVISPLMALMKDQVDSLKAIGIEATYINSSLDFAEMRRRCQLMADGHYRLVYVAPERFRNRHFAAMLPRTRVALLAVDEAHCISQWGYDFRPDYMRLRQIREQVGRPQVLALTATATPEVIEDIGRQLGLSDPTVVVRGFSRPNLTLSVHRVGSHQEKLLRCCQILSEWRTGLIYCATRAGTEKVATKLSAAGIRCLPYHGGMGNAQRRQTQERFLSRRASVVAATNAFGMGIDRNDLRSVIHWDVPGSIEAYYQEAGRAGRDGQPAHCELLFNHADIRTQKFFIEGANPSPGLVQAVAALLRELCEQGPANLDQRDLATRLGPSVNAMAVGTALRLLERAGMIGRYHDPTQSVPLTSLLDADLDLTEILTPLPAKAERDYARLRRLLRYIDSRSCRHAAILRYFGDPAHGEWTNCQQCDNCVQPSSGSAPAKRMPSPAEWREILKVLEGARSLGGRFGKSRLVQLLSGSKDKAVLRYGLQRSTHYASLAGRSQPYLRKLIDLLHDEALLETQGDEYPTLRLTRRGLDTLREQKAIEISLPGPSKAKRKTQPSQPRSQSSCEAPTAMVTALQNLRSQLAHKRGVPAYVILHNKTIDEIARMAPSDHAGLLAISGIGPAKLADIGDQILQAIGQAAHSQ